MIADISKHVKEESLALEKGDFLVVYSDGIPEAWKNEKENYGIEKLVEFASSCGKFETAAEIKEAILRDVKEFAGGYKQQDDITLIVIKKV